MILLLLYAPYLLLSIVTIFCGNLFVLAGLDKKLAFQPIINVFHWFKIARFRPILGVLFFIPYFNFLFIIILAIGIIRSYQPRHKSVTAWGSILWFIGLPILNNNATAYNKSDASLVQWNLLAFDVVLFILIKRSIINTFIFSVYAIPTSSMEKTFMTGDLVFTERVSFGPRVPVTPLSLPFLHNRLPNSGTPSYWVKPQLGYYRFPGFSTIKHNDVLVFNYPIQTQYPVDKREYYMKRCIALPGDTLRIVDAVVYINGAKAWEPPKGQKTYLLQTDGTPLEMDIYMKYNITDGGKYGDEPGRYVLGLTPAMLDSLKALPYVKHTEQSIKPKNAVDVQRYYYPADTNRYHWNSDQYGPLVIPKKGIIVSLNKDNISLYQTLIAIYEHNSFAFDKDSLIIINGQKVDHYTFKMDYYFMMGDNRDNSEDSRFWGLVPEDHIDSKVVRAFTPPNWMHKRF